MIQRIKKSLPSPFKKIMAKARAVIKNSKYRRLKGYQAKKYWRDRLLFYKFNLQGVGNTTLSEKENQQAYRQARDIFLKVCQQAGVDFKKVRVLDIGCGSGFYTQVLSEAGVLDYLGVDITDQLFNLLQERFLTFQFQELDISTQSLSNMFDLIIMIDVTQHITEEAKFAFAMQNIREHLKEKGIFIVTSWLDDSVRNSFYEKSRSIDAYRKEFFDYQFSEPIPFRDKYIFSILKNDG